MIVAIAGIVIMGCAGSSTFVDTSNLPDTYQCGYMKDICKESQDFESKYEAMNPDEKKEFKNLLMVYRKQCSSALEECKKSGSK